MKSIDGVLAGLGCVVIVLSVAAGCTAVPGAASFQPTDAVNVPASTAPGAADCLAMDVEAGHAPLDINSLRRDATHVFVGEFAGYKDAQWTTPDEHRPTKAEFQAAAARLVRPLHIDIKGEIKGPREAAAHTVQRGGTSGCDSITYSNEPVLADGKRYVFFVVPLTNSRQGPTDEFLLLVAFPIGPDNKVDTPADGKLSLDEVKDGVLHRRKPTPPANEPEPSGPG